jgi:hypothetical protein
MSGASSLALPSFTPLRNRKATSFILWRRKATMNPALREIYLAGRRRAATSLFGRQTDERRAEIRQRKAEATRRCRARMRAAAAAATTRASSSSPPSASALVRRASVQAGAGEPSSPTPQPTLSTPPSPPPPSPHPPPAEPSPGRLPSAPKSGKPLGPHNPPSYPSGLSPTAAVSRGGFGYEKRDLNNLNNASPGAFRGRVVPVSPSARITFLPATEAVRPATAVVDGSAEGSVLLNSSRLGVVLSGVDARSMSRVHLSSFASGACIYVLSGRIEIVHGCTGVGTTSIVSAAAAAASVLPGGDTVSLYAPAGASWSIVARTAATRIFVAVHPLALSAGSDIVGLDLLPPSALPAARTETRSSATMRASAQLRTSTTLALLQDVQSRYFHAAAPTPPGGPDLSALRFPALLVPVQAPGTTFALDLRSLPFLEEPAIRVLNLGDGRRGRSGQEPDGHVVVAAQDRWSVDEVPEQHWSCVRLEPWEDGRVLPGVGRAALPPTAAGVRGIDLSGRSFGGPRAGPAVAASSAASAATAAAAVAAGAAGAVAPGANSAQAGKRPRSSGGGLSAATSPSPSSTPKDIRLCAPDVNPALVAIVFHPDPARASPASYSPSGAAPHPTGLERLCQRGRVREHAEHSRTCGTSEGDKTETSATQKQLSGVKRLSAAEAFAGGSWGPAKTKPPAPSGPAPGLATVRATPVLAKHMLPTVEKHFTSVPPSAAQKRRTTGEGRRLVSLLGPAAEFRKFPSDVFMRVLAADGGSLLFLRIAHAQAAARAAGGAGAGAAAPSASSPPSYAGGRVARNLVSVMQTTEKEVQYIHRGSASDKQRTSLCLFGAMFNQSGGGSGRVAASNSTRSTASMHYLTEAVLPELYRKGRAWEAADPASARANAALMGSLPARSAWLSPWWSTTEVNLNAPTRTHTDAGDHPESYAAISYFTIEGKDGRGPVGSELVFPPLLLVVQTAPGDVVIFRGRQLLHGNLPMSRGGDGEAVRGALVSFIPEDVIRKDGGAAPGAKRRRRAT